jgi:hypothetical protein
MIVKGCDLGLGQEVELGFNITRISQPRNTKGGSIIVPLTSCLTGLESAVWQPIIFVFICKTY